MERPFEVWGDAEPGADVTVALGKNEISGKAGDQGKWRVTMPSLPASDAAAVLKVTSGGESVALEDILVGQVWLCSGQSNMDFPLGRAVGGAEEAKTAGEVPTIRLLNLTAVPTGGRAYTDAEVDRLTPGRCFQGEWKVATEASAREFSAVGWWAGKVIHATAGVPVGLIDNSVGGSGAEAWLPTETLEARNEYAELLKPSWIESERIGAWARGRAQLNLAGRDAKHPFTPGFLYESGVRWWRGFPFTGVLWYQGETNAAVHDDAWNERLITDLVEGWRAQLGQAELPFHMVQLPRIGGNDPSRKWWPEFRGVQSRAAAKMDHVELIETKDLGWDSPDVHPPDKKPVGQRLGRSAAGLDG
ncbi:sialate O-acetylesterase [Haloferula helveola]